VFLHISADLQGKQSAKRKKNSKRVPDKTVKVAAWLNGILLLIAINEVHQR